MTDDAETFSSVAAVMETFVGAGRPISVEKLWRAGCANESTAYEWRSGKTALREHNIVALLGSTLPVEFRLALSQALHSRSHDVKPAIVKVGKSTESPLRLTFDLDGELTALQREIHDAVNERSVAGGSICEEEAGRIYPLLTRAETLLAQVRGGVDSLRLKKGA